MDMNNKISISYCLAVHNEHVELSLLLKQLMKFLGEEDEIVIQGDQGKVTDEVVSVIASALKNPQVKYLEFPLRKDFASFKNNLIKNCTKDYCVLIDPDELFHPKFLENLKWLLFENPAFDIFAVPRVNIVQGLTSEYSKSQGWKVEKIQVPKLDYDTKEILSIYGIREKKDKLEIEVVNPYDWQRRIFKRLPNIRFQNKVHEQLLGSSEQTILPVIRDESRWLDFTWCLFHVKNLNRQISQNKFYETIC